MKQLVVLAGYAVFLLGIAGCGQQSEKISSQPQLESKIGEEVLYENWDGEAYEDPFPDFFGDQSQRGAFPESMVGVWEAEVSSLGKWGIKFEPDGSINKIIHSLAGPVNVTEGGVSAEGPDDSYYDFVMGPCEARYIPKTRMIKVKITVDYFIMKIPAGELEGRIEDYFEGPVSEDGKTWKANLLNFCWVKGAAIPEPNLIKAYPEPLVFTKLDLTQMMQKDNAQ